MARTSPNLQRVIPTIRLDLSIPEHAGIWQSYQDVSPSGRAEWVRLRLMAGIRALQTEAPGAAIVETVRAPAVPMVEVMRENVTPRLKKAPAVRQRTAGGAHDSQDVGAGPGPSVLSGMFSTS